MKIFLNYCWSQGQGFTPGSGESDWLLIMTEYEMVGYSLGSTTLSWKARTVQASQKLYNMYLWKQPNSIEIVLCRENGLISGKENNVYCLYFKNHLSFKCKRRNFIFFFYITLLYFKIELSYQELNHLWIV